MWGNTHPAVTLVPPFFFFLLVPSAGSKKNVRRYCTFFFLLLPPWRYRGHWAGPSPPSPLLYAPSIFFCENNSACSSLVDWDRVAPTPTLPYTMQKPVHLPPVPTSLSSKKDVQPRNPGSLFLRTLRSIRRWLGEMSAAWYLFNPLQEERMLKVRCCVWHDRMLEGFEPRSDWCLLEGPTLV